MKQNSVLLAGTIILALVLVLAAPVSAAKTLGIHAGDGQTATVGTAVAVQPSVRIAEGNTPLSGIPVTFVVTGGGGFVTEATVKTNTIGIATAGSWKLGTTAGTNTLTATAGSLTAAFTATGTAGAATRMVKSGGDGQSATAGTAVAVPPGVRVTDVYDNPVKGRAVLFTISVGGGSVSPTTTITTGADGTATVTRWTLGPAAGTNSLIATSGSLTPVTFIATAKPSLPAPYITGISPTGAANTGLQTIDISGTGFNRSTVTLTKTGQPNITGVMVGTDTATRLGRTFNLNGVVPGSWTLILLNSDGRKATGPFTVRSATAAVTAISPTTGKAGTKVAATISGTGFIPAFAKIRLYRSGNYISGAVDTGGSSTRLTGLFDLNQAISGTYDVCVLPDGTETSKTCGPAFTIYADYGSIHVRSSPSSGSVYLDNIFKGYTPITLERITPGTYTVMVRTTGYSDWSGRVTVTGGYDSTVYAPLVLIQLPTPGETSPIITKPPPEVTTTGPGTLPASGASLVAPVIAMGIACLVSIALRKH
jgi:hypothetical protein